MKITSSDFKHSGKIPTKFTGDGENINPNLVIEGAPNNCRSLVLIVDDPDAPAGNWIHWIVWNIQPNTKEIKENSIPSKSIQGKNTSRDVGYEGPCPPGGTHRYFFRLYALDCMLNLKIGSNREDLEEAMKRHILDKTELIGLYR